MTRPKPKYADALMLLLITGHTYTKKQLRRLIIEKLGVQENLIIASILLSITPKLTDNGNFTYTKK